VSSPIEETGSWPSGGGGAGQQRGLRARVPGRDLAADQVLGGRLDGLSGRQERPVLQEPAVGAPAGETPLDLGALLEPGPRVDGDQLARAELAAPHSHPLGQRDCARLRRAGDEAVVGDRVAEGPEAVAVERGADDAPVGEDDRGRPVPRLDQAGVVAIERRDGVARRAGVGRLGDQHRERVPHVPAPVDEPFDGVVEHARVGGLRVDQPGLPGAHPVRVPGDRVDLAVVTEEPERLRALPRGLGVRREALVEDPERHREAGFAEVRVERRELRRGAERLVDHGAERERGDVRADGLLGPSAGAVRAILRFDQAGAVGTKEDELLDARRGRLGACSERVRLHRHRPPAAGVDSLGAARLLDRRASRFVAEEDHREPAPRPGDERGGNRQQDARSVAGAAIRRDCAAVPDSAQTLEQRFDDGSRRPSLHVGDEADTARISLCAWIVEAVLDGNHPLWCAARRIRLWVSASRRRREDEGAG